MRARCDVGSSRSGQSHRLLTDRRTRHRGRCVSCGTRTQLVSNLPFCARCLDWSSQANLTEWDDLGAGD